VVRDTLYVNGIVYSMDEGTVPAEALLVRGGRIATVGSNDMVREAATAGARSVDLEGQTVVPGFNDSHAHILSFGLTLEQLDVSVDAVRTIGDIQRALTRRVVESPPGGWILGRGYDQNMLAENRHPTRHDLDEVSPHHPVMLGHTSGHVLTCNSRALEVAGITAGTVDPFGGVIDRDDRGQPTGVLKEGAMKMIDAVIPPPSVEQGAQAIIRAMEKMASFGITSASDAATGSAGSLETTLCMYRNASASGNLKARITLMPQIFLVAPPGTKDIVRQQELDAGPAPEWLHIGPTKIFSDGALSTRTAALRQGYADDPNNKGILLWEQDALSDMIYRTHNAGWQIAAHALGDRAVEAVLDAYEQALMTSPRSDHRHRIEHCMIADEGLTIRIRDLGIVPSLQPDIFRLGDGYVTGLGVERASSSIPVGLFRRLGVPIAFSSDCPVIPCNPLPIVRSAIERKTPSGVSLGREHSVTAMEGIRYYTAGGAYATHTDQHKGTLLVGKYADFAVLSQDPSAVPLGEFDGVRVTMTVTGGNEVFHE
jgi:predicted amidohydrolase YtcJ